MDCVLFYLAGYTISKKNKKLQNSANILFVVGAKRSVKHAHIDLCRHTQKKKQKKNCWLLTVYSWKKKRDLAIA